MAYEEIKSLDSLRKVIDELAARVPGTADWLPGYLSPDGALDEYLTYEGGQFRLVMLDEGTDYTRLETRDVEVLLFFIFQNAVGYMSRHIFYSQPRARGVDFRRRLDELEIEMIGRFKPEWKEQRAVQILERVREDPYDDQIEDRVAYQLELEKSSGLSPQEIYAKACERFPRPKRGSAA
jgi:hypothetical protein